MTRSPEKTRGWSWRSRSTKCSAAFAGASLCLAAACSSFEGDPEPPVAPSSDASATPGEDAAASAPRVRCNLADQPRACSGDTPVCCHVFTRTPSTCGAPDATCTNAFRCDDATDCTAFGSGYKCCATVRGDRTTLIKSACAASCGVDDVELCDTTSPPTQACSAGRSCRPSGRLPDASDDLSPKDYDLCLP